MKITVNYFYDTKKTQNTIIYFFIKNMSFRNLSFSFNVLQKFNRYTEARVIYLLHCFFYLRMLL